jgi:hypothetical protein
VVRAAEVAVEKARAAAAPDHLDRRAAAEVVVEEAGKEEVAPMAAPYVRRRPVRCLIAKCPRLSRRCQLRDGVLDGSGQIISAVPLVENLA